ncbi:hypothetical protein H8D30_04360 [bacterium]|nr:hypothetical protein [bacterium]
MKVTYFPGGLLTSNYKDFENSVSRCLRRLGADYELIHNWSGTGDEGTYFNDPLAALALPLRNLVIGEKSTRNDLFFVPDPLLYQTFERAVQRLEEPRNDALRQRMVDTLGLPYSGRMRPVNILHMLKSHTAGKKFDRLIMRRLEGGDEENPTPLRVAVHTPPELMRPVERLRIDRPESPVLLKNLLQKAGAHCVDWASASRWLGGYLGEIDQASALALAKPVIEDAHVAGAEVIVTLEPRALQTLDQYQKEAMGTLGLQGDPLPIMYATDLLNLALGVGAATLGTGFHITSCNPVFERIGLTIQ